MGYRADGDDDKENKLKIDKLGDVDDAEVDDKADCSLVINVDSDSSDDGERDG